MEEQLIETWQIHNRIQIYVIRALSAEQFAAAAGKGKSVAQQFAHVHNVRLMWLKASAPTLLDQVSKLDTGGELAAESLITAFEASGEAIETVVREALAAGTKVKGFKPSTPAFVGYFISHESYHLGKVDMTLRQCGCPMDDKTHYGIWEWGSR